MALSRRHRPQASTTAKGAARPSKSEGKRVKKGSSADCGVHSGASNPLIEVQRDACTKQTSKDDVGAAGEEPPHYQQEQLEAPQLETEGAGSTQETQDVTFSSLGVCPSLCSVLQHLSLLEPTPVQRCSLPLGLSGHDFCAIAPTGTGKTLCYLLPVLQRIQRGMGHTFMSVVLLPARELVSQVGEQFGVYGQHLGLRWVEVTGGRDMMVEAEALQQQAPHVVLATPGRLADLLQRERGLAAAEAEASPTAPDISGSENEEETSENISSRNSRNGHTADVPPRLLRGPIHDRLQAVDCLVLDEADRLLSEEFGPDLRLLLSSLPASSAGRQTLLLSASSSPALLQLQQQFGDSRMPLLLPEKAARCPPLLQHRYIFVPAAMRGVYVLHLLQQEPFASQRGIIFSGSVRKTQQLATALQQLEVDCVCIHSLLQQRQRVAALRAFRSEHKRILVATDVAARGLDLPNLDFVVNLQPPKEPETYIHRVGRTARAGRKGLAITFVDPADVAAVHRVESYIGRRLEEQPLAPLGLARVVRDVLSAEVKAAEKLRANGFNQKAEIYETAQKEYRRLRKERRSRE
ncbi:ATP-dependent RNA helicase, putative [Eimeria mitis]|uniref:ATP-dependent RNA helicase, putative n=1 Tax=Eimeria mitis TaxID=44415 RepID=U6JY19_9EIME|nr:ATP-dependent RNA helicase, putative [Eimeria mitis]CDJ28408.1 ATP-dependent RNA helicase, putative [Eimeria mitis]